MTDVWTVAEIAKDERYEEFFKSFSQFSHQKQAYLARLLTARGFVGVINFLLEKGGNELLGGDITQNKKNAYDIAHQRYLQTGKKEYLQICQTLEKFGIKPLGDMTKIQNEVQPLSENKEKSGSCVEGANKDSLNLKMAELQVLIQKRRNEDGRGGK